MYVFLDSYMSSGVIISDKTMTGSRKYVGKLTGALGDDRRKISAVFNFDRADYAQY